MNWGSLVASLLFLVTLSGFAQSTRPGRSQRTDSPAKVIESFEQRRPDAKAVWLPKPIARPSDTFHVDLTRTSRVELPAPEQTEVERKFAAAARRDSRRTMIGIERDTDVSPGAQGEWVRLSINSSKRLWTLTFTSKQARELRVHFSDFALPPGSKLYLYAPGDTTFTQVFEGKG